MKLISVIIPTYNEEKNIPLLYQELKKVFSSLPNYLFEIIFVNDGSRDDSLREIEKLAEKDKRVKFMDFSKNFGKEIATTAGINNCQGDACLMIDADLQHPPEIIKEFLKKWQEGFEVVVGVRKKNKGEGIIKRLGSFLFYRILFLISETKTVAGATDFRLIDKIVIKEFNCLTERNRITRGLIDWLGFKRTYIYFQANSRTLGKPAYSFLKLFRLAISSFVSQSLFPLKFAGYLGLTIMFFSGLFGAFIFMNKFIFNDPFGYSFSGPAILAVLNIFLIGIVLSCLGLIALYIANINNEVVNRPIYVIRKKRL